MADSSLFLGYGKIINELRAELDEKTRELATARGVLEALEITVTPDEALTQAAGSIMRLQDELAEARAELTEAQRGDPDGHLCSVYQVLGGAETRARTVAELFVDGEPQYGRVVARAKELRTENERLRAAIKLALTGVDPDAPWLPADCWSVLTGALASGSPEPGSAEATLDSSKRAKVLDVYREWNRELTTPPAPASPVECAGCGWRGVPNRYPGVGPYCGGCGNDGPFKPSPAESREDGES